MKRKVVEICCGSYYDGLQAKAGGAERIELNSALHLGGLTPSLAELILLKRDTNLSIISMIRPRAAGFCYEKQDFETMVTDCRILLEHGADGIVFGCLHPDKTIHLEQAEILVSLIKSYRKEAVFHRAFDCVSDPDEAMEQLIGLNIDRVLTGGLKVRAVDGAALLARLQRQYGSHIEILPGGGINHTNAADLLRQTGLDQLHSSCKAWRPDQTTIGSQVTYAYQSAASPADDPGCYDVVSAELVKKLISCV